MATEKWSVEQGTSEGGIKNGLKKDKLIRMEIGKEQEFTEEMFYCAAGLGNLLEAVRNATKIN